MTPRSQPMPQQTKKLRFNLANFLKKLTLEPMVLGDTTPPMPPPHTRSPLAPIKMRPGSVRFLKEITIMRSFEKDARIHFEGNTRVDGDAVRSLQLYTQEPTKKLLQKSKTNPYHFETRNDVRRAIHQVDMPVHQVTSSTSEKQYRSFEGIEPIYIRNTRVNKGYKLGSVKCIVVVVAPWEFSRQDFQEFSTTQKWPDKKTINDRIFNKSLTNAKLMWAYVHDICVRHKCTNFVLTSYEMWAFGRFSPFYTLGSVSNVFPWNWRSAFPHCSVLEMFVYWILNAFNLIVSGDMLVEADYKNAQEYKYMNEVCCSVGDILDADPGAVMALCHAS